MEDPAASSEKDGSQEQPELNGMKRKRPQTSVPEIPPRGIFSSAVFKIHSETTLLLSPKRRKSHQGKTFIRLQLLRPSVSPGVPQCPPVSPRVPGVLFRFVVTITLIFQLKHQN